MWKTLFKSESTTNGPPHFDSACDGVGLNVSYPPPFCKRSYLSIISNKSIRACIVSLLKLCSPPAIIFTIITVIIYSIKLHAIWSLSHISIEILKFLPPGAYFYPAPTISFVCLTFSIFTSFMHTSPNPPLSCACLAVFRRLHFSDVPIVTAARFSMTGDQVTSVYDNIISAITQTLQPSNMFTNPRRFHDNKQLSKPHPSVIFHKPSTIPQEPIQSSVLGVS